MSDELERKMQMPARHQVMVCEVREGALWPVLIVSQGEHGAVIQSGAKNAARAMAVLPQALAAVEAELARVQAAKEQLAALIREQAAACLTTSTTQGTDE